MAAARSIVSKGLSLSWLAGSVGRSKHSLIKAPDASALGWLEVTGRTGGSSEEGVVDRGRHRKAGCISPDT